MFLLGENATELKKRGWQQAPHTHKHRHRACCCSSPCPASFVAMPCVVLIIIRHRARRRCRCAGAFACVVPALLLSLHPHCCHHCTDITALVALSPLPLSRWHCHPCRTRIICPITMPLATRRCMWHCCCACCCLTPCPALSLPYPALSLSYASASTGMPTALPLWTALLAPSLWCLPFHHRGRTWHCHRIQSYNLNATIYIDYIIGGIKPGSIAALGTIAPGSHILSYIYAPQIHYDLGGKPIGFVGNSSNKYGEFSCAYPDIKSFSLFPIIALKTTMDIKLIHPNIQPLNKSILSDTAWKEHQGKLIGTVLPNTFIIYFSQDIPQGEISSDEVKPGSRFCIARRSRGDAHTLGGVRGCSFAHSMVAVATPTLAVKS